MSRKPAEDAALEAAIDVAIESRDYERISTEMSDGRRLDLMARLIKDSKVLVVFGQDAIVRSRHTLPRFFRWSWMKERPYSAVFLNDPTLYINDHIEGGWFQGTAECDYMVETAEIVNRIAGILGVRSKNVVYFGASAGGFTSAIMAAMSRANALIDIPQFDLLNYHVERAKRELLETCYGKRSTYEEFRARLSVVDFMVARNTWPKRLWIVQNLCDTRHINGQFTPFVNRFVREIGDRCEPVDLRIYSSQRLSPQRGGHIPASESEMMGHLDRIVALSRQDPEVVDVDKVP